MKLNPTFIKLMMMTTSDNDSEALVAIRKANRIMRNAGVSWEQLLSLPRRPVPPNWNDANINTNGQGRDRRHDDKREIDELFSSAFAKIRNPEFENFLNSIHAWWLTKHWLTEKQYRSLRRAAGV